ncbi:MAG: sigma-70 family RNA polymerase sigma factor [Planctomycetes bacterium]|nr:sigma-70 family RNA polymerase sigma factor [Planctomycetota bacterium]
MEDSRSDRDLVLAFRLGDREMFAVLVRRYEEPLYRFFRRHAVAPDVADDLFQETFLRVFRGLGSFDAEREFRPWLYTVALNCLRKRIGRRDAREPAPQALPDGDAPGAPPSGERAPEAAAADHELAERVRRAVATLPDGPREVFTLYQYQGLSYAQIAETVDRPLGTVKSLMHSALVRLREELGDYLKA